MAAARVVLLLLLAATAAAGPLSKPASGQMPACSCHDVDPRTEFWKPFIEGQDLTCLDQALKGGCGQAFMKTAIAEVGEFCQISCGSCACCQPLLTVAGETAGGGEFAWAFNASQPYLNRDRAPLTQPGFMATVLVPPNDAMASVVRRLGGRGRIESDEGARAALSAIVAAHILPPDSEYNALWSSPFLWRAGGRQLPTYAEGVALKVATASDGVTFTPILLAKDGGGKEGAASARMAGKDSGRLDLEACKGFVVGVDQVILPYPLP